MNKFFWFVVISGFCGGSVYPLIKIGRAYDIPTYAYIFWESLFIITLVLIFALFTKERPLDLKDWKYYLFCGFTNILIPQTIAFFVAPQVPVTIISVLIILTPLIVYGLLLGFFGEPFVKRKAIALLIGFAGAGLLVLHKGQDGALVTGLLWVLAGALLPLDYAINRIYASRLIPLQSSSSSLAIGLFSVAALGAGLMMVLQQKFYVPLHFHAGDYSLFAHAVLMTVFYVMFFEIARKGAVKNSLTFYLAPLVGAGWGVMIFGESITMALVASTLLIFFALHLLMKE